MRQIARDTGDKSQTTRCHHTAGIVPRCAPSRKSYLGLCGSAGFLQRSHARFAVAGLTWPFRFIVTRVRAMIRPRGLNGKLPRSLQFLSRATERLALRDPHAAAGQNARLRRFRRGGFSAGSLGRTLRGKSRVGPVRSSVRTSLRLNATNVAYWHEADSSARQHHFRFEVNCGPDCIGRWRVRRSRGRAEQLLGWHKPNLEPVLRQNPFRSSAAQGRRPAARPRLSLFKAGSHPPSTGRTGRCSTAARGRRRPAEVEA
jgi:hypothetical protein